MAGNPSRKTTVGQIDDQVLRFTAGRDVELDHKLISVDCIGSAAHAEMLSRIDISPRILTKKDVGALKKELAAVMEQAEQGRFNIRPADQDVHMAVERHLTSKLGDVGKRIHTARSRNDQVAVDLRLYGKERLLLILNTLGLLIQVFLRFAEKHADVPMVGRTHMQPAMPSSVGLWASACAESLLDDAAQLLAAYEQNDQCPLGSAAGYGVPLNIDRVWVSEALGFERLCHNVLYASAARGKTEGVILSALSQVMLTLSRVAQDLMIFTMPEFGYFSFPPEFGTGSSIMPQKNNPDVLELLRGKAGRVMAHALAVQEVIKSSPLSYNRDLQETKEPYLDGLQITLDSLEIMIPFMKRLKVNRKALRGAFTPAVYATDKALELVLSGMSFRDAYHYVKEHLDELEQMQPDAAIACKVHVGGTAGLDFDYLKGRAQSVCETAREEKNFYCRKISKLLGITYRLQM